MILNIFPEGTELNIFFRNIDSIKNEMLAMVEWESHSAITNVRTNFDNLFVFLPGIRTRKVYIICSKEYFAKSNFSGTNKNVAA
jgi:hypothetical protein